MRHFCVSRFCFYFWIITFVFLVFSNFNLFQNIGLRFGKEVVKSNVNLRGIYSGIENQGNQNSMKIPQHMIDFVHELTKEDKFDIPLCTENIHTNFVFLKTHKCASDTLSSIFRKFALDKNLTVVLPVTSYLLGWPYELKPFMYRQSKSGIYNIILDHAIYNHSFMSSIMPKDVVYITTIREPFARLKSSLSFFAFRKRAFLDKDDDVVQSFLDDMDHLDSLYSSSSHTKYRMCDCVPPGISITKNAMAFDLGFPSGFHFHTKDQSGNYTFIKQWLKDIHDQVRLTVIVEYFHESLILLKRYSCWNWKNVLYLKRNYQNKVLNVNYATSQIDAYKEWNNIDTLLYELSNLTFWNRISKFGPDFHDEVNAFNDHLKQALQFCQSVSKDEYYTFQDTKWNSGYTLTYTDCKMIYDENALRKDVKMDGNTYEPDIITLKSKYGIQWC